MATNSCGQTYSGNDDFRGWLAAGNAGGPYGYGVDLGLSPLSTQGFSSALLKNLGNGNPPRVQGILYTGNEYIG